MTGQAIAVAHPNIALVKYWGKSDTRLNVPAMGSLSITLAGLETVTKVSLSGVPEPDLVVLDGSRDGEAGARVSRWLDLFRIATGRAFSASVESRNSFPTAAGLASSASGFAALAVAVDRAAGTRLETGELRELTRRGSGSAARSLLGGFVALEVAQGPHGRAVTLRQLAPPDEWPLEAVVAVTARAPKAVGSTSAMERSARTSPFYAGWVERAGADLDAALDAVSTHDFEALATVAEHNCLKMHGVMTSSRPPLLYWNAATFRCIHRILELRAAGIGVFFTIDAGPQVKAVCLPGAGDAVAAALAEEEGVVSIIRSGLGEGARVVEAPS